MLEFNDNCATQITRYHPVPEVPDLSANFMALALPPADARRVNRRKLRIVIGRAP